MSSDAFDSRNFTQSREAFRGEIVQNLPTAFELIDLSDELYKVGR